jgi:prephenate dehydratase
MTSPRLVYLGPEGTFTHQAALALAPAGCDLVALESVNAVLAELSDGAADYAVAALDSAAGPIAETQAALETGGVEAIGRHALPVSFDLYRRRADNAALTGVYGHEKALAQCMSWIAGQGLKTRALASNTAGLAQVRDGGEPGWGALGPPGLAEAYGLAVCAQALEGPARNHTVFVLLRRAGTA